MRRATVSRQDGCVASANAMQRSRGLSSNKPAEERTTATRTRTLPSSSTGSAPAQAIPTKRIRNLGREEIETRLMKRPRTESKMSLEKVLDRPELRELLRTDELGVDAEEEVDVSDSESEAIDESVAGNRTRVLSRRSKRRLKAWVKKLVAHSDLAEAMTFLEMSSVSGETLKQYQEQLEKFYVWAEGTGEELDATNADEKLVLYM